MKFGVKNYIGDAVVCIILAAVLICASVLFSIGGNDNTKVRILRDGKTEAELDLSQDVFRDIDGVQIKIKDGRAYICDSDCPDKICMNMHGVDKNGGGAVCIPNRIVLEPVSDIGNSDTDIVAG